jgi:hypothetical protein
MSVSQWDNFTNYVVGDQVQNGSSVIYTCILANINQPPPNATYWSVNPSGAGITSIDANGNVNTGPAIAFVNASNSVRVVSTNPNIVEWGINPSIFGIYTQVGAGSTSTTITATLCAANSVVLATYIHAGGGGGSQYITAITPVAGSFTITTNTVVDAGDQINWLILNQY